MKLPFPAISVLVVVVGLFGGCGDGHSPDATGRVTSKSEVQRQEDGAASIVGFGSEATGGERAAVLGAFRGYLKALAVEDLPAACSLLSAPTQQSVQEYAGTKPGPGGCSESLAKLLTPSASRAARLQLKGSVSAVREEGDRAFVVFHAPGAKLFQQTMVREGGNWKLATVVASVLVPSPATLNR